MKDMRELEHTLKNQLSIILGFSELLLQESAADDPRRDDFVEIHKAAAAAVQVVSDLGEEGA
jgi:signal transduction histidine kinase